MLYQIETKQGDVRGAQNISVVTLLNVLAW